MERESLRGLWKRCIDRLDRLDLKIFQNGYIHQQFHITERKKEPLYWHMYVQNFGFVSQLTTFKLCSISSTFFIKH